MNSKAKVIIKLMMFKIKQRTKYPVEYSRKCHEKMIPIIESAKNQIANKIAKVNPPISREHRNKTPIPSSNQKYYEI